MFKLSTVAVIAACCALAQSPDLSGVWEWNRQGPPAAANAPERVRYKVEQQGAAITVTMRAVAGSRRDQLVQKLIIGQDTRNEMHGAPMTSHAEWDHDTLVVQSVGVIANKELHLAGRWTVSPDGKTLTFRERRRYGDEAEAEDVRVFERRPGNSWEPDGPPQMAEEVYRNIQIMKGVPAQRIPGVMNNLTRWLGVECAYCHVMGQFEKDDKPPKQAARKMFGMVRAIGKDYFDGSNPVTCWTCHRGAAKPQSLPPQQ